MTSIIERSRLLPYVSLCREHNVDTGFIVLAHGTAPTEVLGYLGVSDSEKAVCFSVITGDVYRKLKKDLQRKLRIDVPGTGIAFIVPMSSIGGERELAFLTAGQEYERGEESVMKNTAHELLVTICNQGYSEQVMDAARSAGAAGGTVIHAQGTGLQKAEKFLGISLSSEKDVIFIVSKTKEKNGIMQAVMKNAGLETKAQAIIFSLPVTDTAGLRILEDDTEETGETPAAEGGANEA